jgi:hypothetical protein
MFDMFNNKQKKGHCFGSLFNVHLMSIRIKVKIPNVFFTKIIEIMVLIIITSNGSSERFFTAYLSFKSCEA